MLAVATVADQRVSSGTGVGDCPDEEGSRRGSAARSDCRGCRLDFGLGRQGTGCTGSRFPSMGRASHAAIAPIPGLETDEARSYRRRTGCRTPGTPCRGTRGPPGLELRKLDHRVMGADASGTGEDRDLLRLVEHCRSEVDLLVGEVGSPGWSRGSAGGRAGRSTWRRTVRRGSRDGDAALFDGGADRDVQDPRELRWCMREFAADRASSNSRSGWVSWK